MKKLLIISFYFFCLHLYSQNDTCNFYTEDLDKFDGKITFDTYTDGGVSFVKVISKANIITYYISLSVEGATLNYGLKGVTILLKNGKIEKPLEKVSVDINKKTYQYVYSAFCALSKQDIQKIKSSKITDFRLYIYDKNIREEDQDRILKTFNCLLLAKKI